MIIDIPLTLVLMSAGIILALIGLAVIGWFLIKYIQRVTAYIDLLQEYGMNKDELIEMVQRQFVILLKDDELFRKHITKRVMSDKRKSKK